MKSRFVQSFLLLVIGGAFGLLLYAAAPLGGLRLFDARQAEPLSVAARGELAPNEQTVIALFEAARISVVSITTASRVFDQRLEQRQGHGSRRLLGLPRLPRDRSRTGARPASRQPSLRTRSPTDTRPSHTTRA